MTRLSDIAATPLSDVERRPPITVGPDTPLSAVVEQLHEHHRSAVLVKQDGALIGVFTERDLMARVDHADAGWATTPVRDVMTKSPKTMRTDQTVEDALNAMVVGGYRHLPTMTPDGQLEGVISILDLLVHITEFFPEDFTNLPSDPEHEARGRWGG